MATQTEIDALNSSLASASAAAKAASADADTYASQVSAIDKQLSAAGIASGQVGVEMSPTELLAFQLKQIDARASSPGYTPEYIARTKAIIQDRAKVAIVAEEKNAVAQSAYKAADAIDIQIEQKQTALAGGNTSTIAPAAASAAPGDPTTYTPPPTVTPVTTVATATTPTAESIANRTVLVASKGEPVTAKTDPNNQDVTIYTYSDGSTARRTGGRNAQIIPDVPVSVSPISVAAKEAKDLSDAKKAEADAMQLEVDKLRAQTAKDREALIKAEQSGDPAAIAAAEAKFAESSKASITASKTQLDLASESRMANRQFEYEQTVKTSQEAANANGGGTVAPASVNTNSETIPQPVAATGEVNIDEPIEPSNDPVSRQADENNGFVFDPVTGEMIPGDSSYAAELIEIDTLSDPLLTPDGVTEGEGDAGTGLEEPVEVDPENEPLRTPDGGIDDEGDAGTGLEEPVEVDPENEPLRTPDGTIEGEGDAGTGLEEPPIDPNDDPAVRALMESSRQEAEDEFEFGNAPNTDDFDPPPPQKDLPKPPAAKDWRVRISLAQGAKYFYAGDTPGILKPLAGTSGVVFPYTPTISVTYNAKYDSQSITHSNFSFHNYTGSSVDQISISGEFTAQDTTEAAYMLAVIHFFRSATKMFYGKDQNPDRGTPPPLLYLSGHGNYQFDNHPMVLTNFSYSLPNDVDYINAYPDGAGALNTMPLAPYDKPNPAKPTVFASAMQRLTGSGLQPGGMCKKPIFVNSPNGVEVVTRVPTKISIALTFLPVVTRNAITNEFSLKKYASGALLRGSKNTGTGGGIW